MSVVFVRVTIPDVWVFDFLKISKIVLEHWEVKRHQNVTQMYSKNYSRPSNALQTNEIHFLDRKNLKMCSEKSEIQTSAPSSSPRSRSRVSVLRMGTVIGQFLFSGNVTKFTPKRPNKPR